MTGLNAGLFTGAASLYPWGTMARDKGIMVDQRSYLGEILYTREEVDSWLAGEAFPFSKYHSRFG